MFKITLEGKFPAIQAVEQFKKEFRNQIVENGLDDILETSVVKLKDELKDLINSKMPSDNQSPSKTFEIDTPRFPQSQEEILKQLTGVDLSKIRATKDYTSAYESNVVFSQGDRVKLNLPMGSFETFDENLDKAKRYFNSSIYAFNVNGQTRYFYNPGIDLSEYVKVVCSTDVGDTGRSRKVFGSYRDSNNRPKQEMSPEGRYSQWTLKQDMVQRILDGQSGFLDITSVINDIQDGDYDKASETLNRFKTNSRLTELADKLGDIKKDKNLNPGIKAYSNIIKLINSFKINKIVNTSKVDYFLAGTDTVDAEGTSYNALYSELTSKVGLWITVEEKDWFGKFVIKAKQLLNQYIKE